MSAIASSDWQEKTGSEQESKGRILVVDDDATERHGLEKLLLAAGYDVEVAEGAAEALVLAEKQRPDLVVTDLRMPGQSGEDLMRELHDRDRELPVIMMTGHADVESAVTAMRLGAEDYVTKPIDFEALQKSIQHAIERFSGAGVHYDRRPLRKPLSSELDGLIGVSEPMQRIYRLARQVAGAKAVVLITGESGTGKSALARAIHAAGPRFARPFVSVHAAALVDSLLESELFGHERGAFTGADKRRTGRFEQADHGTLFLDEIGEIPAATQVKLLRVLQERAFERVGGNQSIEVDIRLIAATSRDLAADVKEGRFREDLYYRLNVVHLEMPPLRIRGDDIALLANEFLKRFARDNRVNIEGFTDRALEKILHHDWPGNVRELENTIERAVVLCEGERVDEQHLSIAKPTGLAKRNCQRLADIEKEAILSTLEAVDWSTSRAAEILDISVRTIQYRLHQYGLANKRRGGGAPP